MKAPDFTLTAEGASSLQRMVSRRPLNRSGATECKKSSGLVGAGGDSKTQPERQTLNELALFAGAGGGILGGKLLGWRTVCAVEYDEHARRVLMARQDDGCLEPFPIWDDVRTFDGKPWRGIVDVVSGGFPCQDISVANSSADGLEGERSGLWREMARIVCEVRPGFVLVENSPALTFRGLGNILGDLAAMGYDARWGVFSAADAGAQHLRERLWIVAHADEMGGKIRVVPKPWRPLPRHRVDFVEHTQFAASAPVLRGDDGVADWMDRIARCGNGQVPAVVRIAWDFLTGGGGAEPVRLRADTEPKSANEKLRDAEPLTGAPATDSKQ